MLVSEPFPELSAEKGMIILGVVEDKAVRFA
jgi:hypothetical protein